ncbi:MAG: hypothetical protein AMJ38_03850 [Dehalococcoidia bacterium DG_22]|nr:MAG: hypothetical protein AMJ38_03850 [Dehalococcoidia bacterium DG_22]
MTIKYRYGRPIREKLFTLEEPGKPLLFDADKGLIADVSVACNVKAFVQGLKGKSQKEAEDAFASFGRKVMEITIGLADGKYLDRTGEMIEKVAQQTGISFPHRFERYVELSLIGSRPLDRWNIAKATTKELRLQLFACAVQKELKEAGIEFQGMPCKALCMASFRAAAEKTGDNLRMELEKTLPQDNVCEFAFFCT